jgi:hypothetical protein
MESQATSKDRRSSVSNETDKHVELPLEVFLLLEEAHADLTCTRKVEEALDALVQHQERTCPYFANVVKRPHRQADSHRQHEGIQAQRMDLMTMPGELDERKLV